jgi:Transmembrane amino acid transporter protein
MSVFHVMVVLSMLFLTGGIQHHPFQSTTTESFVTTKTVAFAIVPVPHAIFIQSGSSSSSVSSSFATSPFRQRSKSRSQQQSFTAITTKKTSAASSALDVPNGGGGSGNGDTTKTPGGGGTATIPNEVFNLVKSIVGAGVLSLPWGVAVYGNAPSAIVPAVLCIAILGICSAYTFGLIGRICQRTQTTSYSDAWDVAVGKKYAPLIAFSCFIDCFAGNLSYSMILADTIKNLFASCGYTITRTNALLSVTSLVLVPLCLLKNLNSLAPFSLLGIIGMLYTTAAMGIRYFGKAYAVGGTYYATQLIQPVFGTAGASAALSPSSLILACMLSNAYIAHFNAPKFLNELQNNTMSRFHQVIAWSFGTAITLYGLITAFGFLTFGTFNTNISLIIHA